jgi:hypothetical protein
MYGTPAGVAALSAQWTDNGEFLDEDIYDIYVKPTDPTLAQVTDWLERTSDTVDNRLADEGFETPVTAPQSIISDISMLVEGIVKDLADYSHGSGRFYTKQALESGLSPYLTIDKEISDWVARRSIGFVKLGLTKRDYPARNDATFEVL